MEQSLHPLWEMTTSVRVGILAQHSCVNFIHASDPLWDGQGCSSPPCCELSSPPGVTAPWFCKQLLQATTDDIEIRICRNEFFGDEDTPVEHIELYIR